MIKLGEGQGRTPFHATYPPKLLLTVGKQPGDNLEYIKIHKDKKSNNS